MLLTMKPCMIAAGPMPKPCIIQTEPMRIISKPTRLVTTRMTISNPRRMSATLRLFAGVDVEVALAFARHAVTNLLVIGRARRYRQTLGLGLGDLLLVDTLAAQRVADGAVAFVARLLEHLVPGARRDHDA